MRADIDVSIPLARGLLAEQHPDLAGLPLEVAANGWDNVMLRLGQCPEDGPPLAVRLPRREAVAHLVTHEQQVLPRLAPALHAAAPGVVVPVPVRIGRPSEALGYPWAWSVTPWVDGVSADATSVAARTAWAEDLARFLAALHRPATDQVPANPFRGVPLSERPEVLDPHRVAERLTRVPARWREAARRLWDAALAAPAYDGPPVWLHGDPHPANLVVQTKGEADDRLAAVVDFGDVTAGDPASDLGSLWLTFDSTGLARARAVIDSTANDGSGWDEATWTRARGWALLFATNMLAYPEEHPRMLPIGEHALTHLLDSAT